ncbi:MAG: protein-tyrosine-phosphatase [Bacteroidota bacterium]
MARTTGFAQLDLFIADRLNEFDLIPKERKPLLLRLSAYIQKKIASDSPVLLNYICTHNSRRSHISQIWSATAAYYFGVPNTNHFSGGTEATAFNPRAVAAIQRAGFELENPGGANPHYLLRFAHDVEPLECFSKTFDDPFNPSVHFAAIMTCSEADTNCPFVPGTEMRLPLTYEDPKVADGTPEEQAKYDERVAQIAREILFAYAQISL